MLVIISDLHLTDGTSGETIRSHAFRIFRERLSELAYEASWRKNGRYKPVDEIDLVLLGDVLDVIRSTKWLEGAVRPWEDPASPAFVQKVAEITDAILQTNADSLAVLRSLHDTTTLPPAVDGKPAPVGREPDAAGRVPVRVRIHYLVGNHDWFYHLPQPDYHPIRRKVIDAMGLANTAEGPFPHDPAGAPEIEGIYQRHEIFARHGDIFDPFNYEGDRVTSSLGDAIVIELLNRFPQAVEQSLGRDLPAECISGLREIDNVRPLLVVPVWINGLLERMCPAPLRKEVKRIWDRLADDFLRLEFVHRRDAVFNLFDSVDRLEWALKFSKGVSFNNLSRLLGWVRERLAAAGDSYYSNAFTERDFKNRQARYVVYGHTHHHEIVPLDSVQLGGRPINQLYLNSGTWRRVHELARLNPAEQEFMGYHVMTYLAFFDSGKPVEDGEAERAGRGFESWSGALGV